MKDLLAKIFLPAHPSSPLSDSFMLCWPAISMMKEVRQQKTNKMQEDEGDGAL
jgi:hypothetical protein